MKVQKTLSVETVEEQAMRDVMDSIRKIVRALRIASRATERESGISAAQLFVLSKLSDGKPVTVNEVAERTLTHQSSVSVVVQRLARRGFVERMRSKKDARKTEIAITPAGRKALLASPNIIQERLIGALSSMDDARRKKLSELLDEWLELAGVAGEPATLFFENDRTPKAKN